MGNSISIERDFSEALRVLTRLGVERYKIQKRLLGSIGTKGKNEAKKAYSSYGLKKRTGALYKSISRKVYKNGKAVVVEAKARNERGVYYGYALSKGSRIRPRKGNKDGFLHFSLSGKWIKAKEVKLKERDFIEEPVRKYLESAKFKRDLDALVEKQIERIEKEEKK